MLLVAILAAGCASDSRLEIPSDAMQTSSGNGKLTYMPAQHGTVYVYDRTAHRIVYSGDIDRHETVNVDPDVDRVTLNGRTVSEHDLRRGNDYEIYFKPTPGRSEHVVIEERHETR